MKAVKPDKKPPPHPSLHQIHAALQLFLHSQDQRYAEAASLTDPEDIPTIYEEDQTQEIHQHSTRSICSMLDKLSRREESIVKMYKKELKSLALEVKRMAQQASEVEAQRQEEIETLKSLKDLQSLQTSGHESLKQQVVKLARQNSQLRNKVTQAQKDNSRQEFKKDCKNQQAEKMSRVMSDNTKLRGEVSLLKSQMAALREAQEWKNLETKGTIEDHQYIKLQLVAKERECEMLIEKLADFEYQMGPAFEWQKQLKKKQDELQQTKVLLKEFKAKLEKGQSSEQCNVDLQKQNEFYKGEVERLYSQFKQVEGKLATAEVSISKINEDHATQLLQFQKVLKAKNRTIIELRKAGVSYSYEKCGLLEKQLMQKDQALKELSNNRSTGT